VSDVNPAGVPTGGDSLTGDNKPTGSDGTLGTDTPSGDAGTPGELSNAASSDASPREPTEPVQSDASTPLAAKSEHTIEGMEH
jgi:hypothetical protein